MASLGVLSEQPDRIVLGKGGPKNVGGLIGVIIFGAIACVGLSALLGEDGIPDPVMLVILLVIGFGVMSMLGGAISNTRVTLDASQHVASRTSTLFFLPTQRQEMSFNLIRDVEVKAAGGGSLAPDSLPVWQTVLHATDGSTMVINDRGTRAEMDALAQQVSVLLNRPVRGAQNVSATTQTVTAGTTPEPSFQSFLNNLGALVGSLAVGERLYAPPVSAYPTQAPPDQDEESDELDEDEFGESANVELESIAAQTPYARASAQMAAQQAATTAGTRQANARMAAEQAATTAGAREANARMAAEQAAASLDMVQTNARMAEEQAAASADIYRTTAQMAQQQAAAGASARQASAQLASQQAAAGASARQTNARMATEQLAAGADVATASAQLAAQQAEAFRSDTGMQMLTGMQFAAASIPFAAASVRLAEQQQTAEAAMGISTPAMMTLPQMSAITSFAPALDMPTFAPLGAEMVVAAPQTEVEIKEVRAQSAAEPSAALDVRALIRQGRQQLGARNFKEAQAFYFRALNLNPADTAAQNDLGVVYYAQNNMAEAERVFRRTVALDPYTFEGRYNLGLVLSRLGRRAEAQEQFRVGAQSAAPNAAGYFEAALRGVLREPMLSSQP